MIITKRKSNVAAAIIAFLLGWAASYVLLLAPEPVIEPSTSSVQGVQSELYDQHAYLFIINQERADRGLGELKLNDKLNTSAQLKANDMKEFDYWAHDNPNGTTPWHFFKLAGYEYEKAGEVLARNYDKPADTIAAWIASPAHYAALMGDYTEVGLGQVSYDGTTVIVGHLAK